MSGNAATAALLNLIYLSRHHFMYRWDANGMGWGRHLGTDVTTAQKIIHWPTPS